MATVVARAPAAPVASPTAYKSGADIESLTLSDFNGYANSQADWASAPAVPAAQKNSLIAVLEFARAGEPSPLGPCGGMTVRDLVATGLPNDQRAKLRSYTRGVATASTAGIAATANVSNALRDGEALDKLEAAVPKPILHQTMGTQEKGKNEFALLVTAGKVDELADYYKKVKPALEAPDGTDIRVFREMITVDGGMT